MQFLCAMIAILTASLGALAASPVSDIEALQRYCLEQGETPETCACLASEVTRHFTEREIRGAALLLQRGTGVEDVPSAITYLQSQGYAFEEILTVVLKVTELEAETLRACRAQQAQSL